MKLISFCITLVIAPLALAAEKPNIIIILVDDMGFSDIGCYGGEIHTPNIDSLAKQGLRFREFYNSGRCCPTRASLMTGLHPHQAGIGYMTENSANHHRGKPGPYQGYLNKRCVTLAEVLKQANYHTMMVGKWHLGLHAKDRWPTRRGFEKFYGLHEGAAHYFNPKHPRGLRLQEKKVDPTPSRPHEKHYYMTDAFTDYACQFITEANENQKKPFFLYLAYNAPHWPLHAKEQDIKKYLGKYQDGWEKISAARLKRMKNMGLIDPSFTPAPHEGPNWETLSTKQQKLLNLKMSAYAACIDSIDQNVGKLINTLKQNKQYQNTIIFFLSDNGACAEGGTLGSGKWDQFFDPNADTYHTLRYGRVWANVSSTPFKLYKHYTHEGGIATPLIVHWPSGIPKEKHNQFVHSYGYLLDFMPTCLELAHATYPKEYKGRQIIPMEGISLMPWIKGETRKRNDIMFFEHEGNGAARQGKWKVVHREKRPWQLYDMSKDRTEMHDQSKNHPEKLKELVDAWNIWAKRCGVNTKR